MDNEKFQSFQTPLAPMRFQSQMGKELKRRYQEGKNVVRLSLARVIKVNYKYNTVDVITTVKKNSTAKNPNDNGKFSARLPISFGGKTPEGNVYGTNTLVTVGSLVLIGFLEGNKEKPIVLNIYGDTDNQSMLTRTTYTSADESDESLQRELWQLFTLYPSMTYKNTDGNGNQEITFSGKSFLYITDTDQDNSYVTDAGFDYQDLPSSRYANGELIEPKSPNAPTVLYVHQGVYNNHRVTFFIKSDGTVRLGSRNTSGEGITFMEMGTDGSFRVMQTKDTEDPEAITEKFSQIALEEDGSVVLQSSEHTLRINNNGVYVDGKSIADLVSGVGGVSQQYVDDLVAPLEQDLLDINATLGDMQGVVDGSFADGIIQQSEAQSIATYENNLNVEKAKLDAQYQELDTNPKLPEDNKVALEAAKADYDEKFNNLISTINDAIADGIATNSEKLNVDNDFADLQISASVLVQQFQAAAHAISQSQADSAEQNANNHTDTLFEVLDGKISMKVDSETYTAFTQDTNFHLQQTDKDIDDITSRVDNVEKKVTYSCQIYSTNGFTFKNGNINTTLYAKLYQGGTDITDQIDDSLFIWTRTSDDEEGDRAWNDAHAVGTKSITITPADVNVRATFNCEVLADFTDTSTT